MSVNKWDENKLVKYNKIDVEQETEKQIIFSLYKATER